MAFDRVALEPGETRMIALTVDRAQLRYWDEGRRRWRHESGRYRIGVGGSSDDSGLLTAELICSPTADGRPGLFLSPKPP